jgi:osmoprotectant transport system permease protein
MSSVLAAAPFVRWEWIPDHVDDIRSQFVEHLLLTALPIVIGSVIAFPLALVALRYPRFYGPLLGVSGLLFTIPSVALFVLMIPFTGLRLPTAVIPLTIYTLLILVRNTVEGLRGVPRDVREAAEAMGYSRSRQLLTVELPLALPVIIAGLRIATVSTIGLVTVTAIIGWGGLGQFFIDGFIRRFATPLLVGLVLSVLLAVGADLLLLAVQRALTPWQRRTGT